MMDMPYRFIWSQILFIRSKKLRPFVTKAGLTSGQPKVLDFVAFHEGSTQKQIAKGCGVEPATMSGIIDGLVKNGYIKKNVAEDNRREYQIFLTESGRKKHSEIRENMDFFENQILKTFTEEEQVLFQSFLDRYYKAWCESEFE